MVLPFRYDFLALSRTCPVGHTALRLMPQGYSMSRVVGMSVCRWWGSCVGVIGSTVKVVGSVHVVMRALW